MYGEHDEDYATVYGGIGASYEDEYQEIYGGMHAYENLGIALPAIGGAISAIGGLFGKSKDAGRLASNKEAYNLAISGNPPYKDQPSALDFLRVMSTSWATSVAKNDAATKYKSALAIINSQKTAGTATPKPATSSPTPVVAGMSVPPLLIAGAAAVGIAILMRKGRR